MRGRGYRGDIAAPGGEGIKYRGMAQDSGHAFYREFFISFSFRFWYDVIICYFGRLFFRDALSQVFYMHIHY